MLDTYIVYNSVFVLVVAFSVLVQRTARKEIEYGGRTLLFLSMAVPAVIRKGIGTDYSQYLLLYKNYRFGADEHEMGFQWLGRIMATSGIEYQYFVGLIAILAIAPVCYYVPKKNFAYFIITYFFLLYLDIIGTSRQDIAVALITCGIFAMYHYRGTIKYLVCNGVGILFHTSAWLCVPLVFLKNIKLNTKAVYILMVAIVIIVIGSNLVPAILSNSLFLESDYGVYAELEEYNKSANVGSGLGIVANILIPALYLIFYRKTSECTDHPGFLAVLAMVYIGCYLLASQVHIFGRLVNVYAFAPAFLIYPVCKAFFKNYTLIPFICFMLMYLIIFEYTIDTARLSLGKGLGISPYKTIF